MESYLEPTDENAFLDFPEKEQPEGNKDWLKCPRCRGRGGWNLKINAFSLRDREDTAENRHRFGHFCAACSVCNGWGWRPLEDVKAGPTRVSWD